MGEKGIEAVIFDLGNVLVDFDHRIAAEKISGHCALSPRKIFELFFDSRLTALFEEGKLPARDFFKRVKKKLKLKMGYAAFLPVWNEIFYLSKKNKGVYRIAACLNKEYRTLLLSNINALHFEYLKENFPVFDVFHEVITSFEAGFRKPHPSIYRKALSILEVKPERVFYTDDRPELVASARKLGIRGFVFRGIERLKKDLLDNGIKMSGQAYEPF